MTAQVVDLESRRRVWRVVKVRCRCCHAEAVSTQHMSCPPDTAECHACGARAVSITHYLRGDHFEPRLDMLQ
jgi:uncharacterized membrane protein